MTGFDIGFLVTVLLAIGLLAAGTGGYALAVVPARKTSSVRLVVVGACLFAFALVFYAIGNPG